MKNKTAIGISILGIIMTAVGFLLVASIPIPEVDCPKLVGNTSKSGCGVFVEMPVEYFILFFAGIIIFLIGLVCLWMNARHKILEKYKK